MNWNWPDSINIVRKRRTRAPLRPRHPARAPRRHPWAPHAHTRARPQITQPIPSERATLAALFVALLCFLGVWLLPNTKALRARLFGGIFGKRRASMRVTTRSMDRVSAPLAASSVATTTTDEESSGTESEEEEVEPKAAASPAKAASPRRSGSTSAGRRRGGKA